MEKLPYWVTRNRKAVKEAWHDDDGYWVQLKPGYIFSNYHSTIIGQDTIAEIKEQLATIEKGEAW